MVREVVTANRCVQWNSGFEADRSLPTEIVTMQRVTLPKTATSQPKLRDSEMQPVRAEVELLAETGFHWKEPSDISRPTSVVGSYTLSSEGRNRTNQDEVPGGLENSEIRGQAWPRFQI